MPIKTKKNNSKFFVDADISKAKTIAKDFYLDEKIFEIAKEKIFAPSWQFIGDDAMLNEKNNVHPFVLFENFMNEPLVLTKNKSNELHCLSNVCTHRGNIIASNSCQAANLKCKYHGRIFDLDGTFHSMPEFKEVKNFPTKTDNLNDLNLFKWNKFLFVALKKKYKPLSFFGEMISRMSWLDIDRFRFSPQHTKEYFVNAHWALYCENFLEGFHIPFVHAGLNELIDYGNYTTELYSKSSLQIGYSKNNIDCFEIPESSTDFGKKIAAYYFFVFPNMMFNFYPWGLSINIVKPINKNKSSITFLTYIYDESKLNKGAGADLHNVELEDEEVVQNVFRGIQSRHYQHGRYSVTREKGVHHFHRLIGEFLK